MEAAYCRDEESRAVVKDSKFDCHLDSLSTAVGQVGVLKVAGSDHSHDLAQISAKGLKELCRGKCQTIHLLLYIVKDFGIAVSADVCSESADQVDVRYTVDIHDVLRIISPLHRCSVGSAGLTEIHPSGIEIVIIIVLCVLSDLLSLISRQLISIKITKYPLEFFECCVLVH